MLVRTSVKLSINKKFELNTKWEYSTIDSTIL